MSRWIDYDAIDYRNDKMIGKSSDFIDGVIYMAERIEEAPSIDIVRCKECKWYSTDIWTTEYWCDRISSWGNCKHVKPDDFCSYGERRE